LAEKSGISVRTLIDFELGVRKPHRNNLLAIRTAIEMAGVSINEKGWICPPSRRR
jgi:hypothetical protein